MTAIYGALILNAREPPPDFGAVFDSIECDSGSMFKTERALPWSSPFDYKHGSINGDTNRVYVSSRGMSYSVHKIGEDNKESTAQQIMYRLLALNAELDEQPKENLVYKYLTHKRVYEKTPGRFLASINNNSSNSKFLIMSRGIPVYFLIACTENTTVLLWSNEQTLEHRLRKAYGTQLFYYRMAPFVDSMVVIHSVYLNTKLRKWTAELSDRLRVVNALEAFLLKSPVTSE